MRQTDIVLHWLDEVTIERACQELSQVAESFGLTTDGFSFAVQEAGPYIHGRSIEHVTSQEANIRTGGGLIREGTGGKWATFSVDENNCEVPKAGFTFHIRLRRSCTIYPLMLQESEIPSALELVSFAQYAARISTADVVYGQDLGAYHEGCFRHPHARDDAVVIWLARWGLNKLPRLYCYGDNPTLRAGFLRYVFADEAGKVLPYESLDANEDCRLLKRRCQLA